MLTVVPITIRAAKAFVAEHHRHHKPPVGHKFSLAVARGGEIVGVAMVGRPVARHLDDGFTLEVNRTCVLEGVMNANSMLYGAAWRAAKAMGYHRIITYTQEGEGGASLRAAGWRVLGERGARAGWSAPSRPREDHGVDRIARVLWGVESSAFRPTTTPSCQSDLASEAQPPRGK